MKQQEYFGTGSIENLQGILKNKDLKKVFLVTGKNSYTLSGGKEILERIFSESSCIYERFSDFSPNPYIEEIQKGLEIFNRQDYDTIIAFGGGSTIDVAKAIKLFHYNDSNKKIPLITIPTTAGSGSEATYFIVYYEGKNKQSKGVPDLTLPDYVIIDPQFTSSLPREIAASTGIDALCQAVESYWSINSIPESKILAEKAINILTKNLEKAVNNNDLISREKVMKAANLAGKAINLTKTTACHSIAYPITSYFNIPHGHAVALTLGEMLIYNSQVTSQDCLDKRGEDYVRKTIKKLTTLLEAKSPVEAADKIKILMNKIGLKSKLSELSLQKSDIEVILENGFNPARVKNNPRLLTQKNLRKILTDIY